MDGVIKFLIKYSSKDNLIDSNQLSKYFDITRTEVRQIINNARSEGIPICSNRWGYYFSTDDEDVQKTVKSLNGRVHANNKAIAGMSAYVGNKTYYDNLL